MVTLGWYHSTSRSRILTWLAATLTCLSRRGHPQQAGVRTCEMEFHKAAASGSCDAPPTDMLTSFKRKLSVFLINSPSDKVIARLIARNSNAVMLAACPDAPAGALYCASKLAAL